MVNLLTATCYKFFENADVMKDGDAKLLLFKVLGTMVQQFRQAFGATTSILHLLSHFDHLVAPLAEFVTSMVADFDGQTVVTELLREIGRNDPRELAQDSNGTRNISGFLAELGSNVPLAILRSGGISVLLPHLNGESYAMRNAIMAVLSSIVCQLVIDGETMEGAKKIREQFQEILEERIMDTSAYVRTKALYLWGNMAAVEVPASAGEEQLGASAIRSSIPRTRMPVLVELAANRLRDKSALVRKEALRLLTQLLVRNPYGGRLPATEWKASEEQATKDISALVGELFVQMQAKQAAAAAVSVSSKKEAAAAAEADAAAKEKGAETKDADADSDSDSEAELLGDDDDDDGDEAAAEATENAADADMDVDAAAAADGPKEDSAEIKLAKLKYVFYSEGAAFATQIDKVMPIAADLLGSKNVTDVKEAINFIEAGSRYGVESSQVAVQKMLALVWSKEDAVKSAVLEAYCRLFVTDNRPETIANNLVNLTCGSNLGELTSLEEMISVLMAEDHISSSVIKALWAMFAGKGKTNTEKSIRALMVLSMCARSDPEIITKNSGLLISIGLSANEDGTYNMNRIKWTCIALQKLEPAPAKRGTTVEVKLFSSSDELFQKLVEALAFDTTEDVPGWHAAVEQGINTIYCLSENPDKICAQIITALSKPVFTAGATPTSAQLARSVFVVGHVALKQLVHLEKIEGEQKRRLRIQEESDKSKKEAGDDGDDSNDIVGGAAASDELADAMAHLAENDLVLGDTLLGTFAPVLVTICSHPEKYTDPTLQSAAVLSLTKYMSVSSRFAEDNLQLLFTLMQTAPEPRIRANCVLAMGDLAFRFANLLEPWTKHMYGRLRDGDVTVRKNAVMVLTHLILNDMIKVKGQVSEMALRLEDGDERVGDLARLFFLELSHKDNAIYNMLPDVISQLASNPELEPPAFNRIMDYLMSFITKGTHSVSLVEKMCYRFRTTQETRQWRYFAHCLSLLTYSDKAIKKLSAQVACFQDTLGDEHVYSSFIEIMTKAKKFSTADMKEAVAELEAKLEEIHNKGQEDDEANAKAEKASRRVAAVKGKARGGGKARSRRALEPVNVDGGDGTTAGNMAEADAEAEEGESDVEMEEVDDTDSDEDNDENENSAPVVAAAKKTQPKSKSKGKSNTKAPAPAPAKSAAARGKKGSRRRAIVDSESDEDDLLA